MWKREFTTEELTAAKGPNWERKEEKSRSCTVEVSSAARHTTSSTWESQRNVQFNWGSKLKVENYKSTKMKHPSQIQNFYKSKLECAPICG